MQFRVKKAALATPLLQFGGKAQGVDYAVTNRYLTRNGAPYIYRMGEMHFSPIFTVWGRCIFRAWMSAIGKRSFAK